MQRKHVLWGVGAVALLAVALLVGFTLFRHNTQPNELAGTAGAALSVNGQAIATAEQVNQAYNRLLRSYRRIYQQKGGDFQALLAGAAGAYYRLQIKYQAAQQLVGQALIEQEARRRGLKPTASELAQASQVRYQKFLHDNGLTEAGLRALFADPAQKRLMQQILGLHEESLQALKDRLRQETEGALIRAKLIRVVLGPNITANSDAGKKRFSAWLDDLRTRSQIAFGDPLLNAYHLEKQIATGKTLQERQRYLAQAVAAYQQIKRQHLANDPHIDYYLGQLYNLQINWDLQLERQLRVQAKNGQPDQRRLSQLEQQIKQNRDKASQIFLSAGADTERQLQTMLSADPGNSLYYYLYARFLISQPRGPIRALRLLERAIELDPQYVDAYVLLGDLNVESEHFSAAIDNYQQALPLAQQPPGGDAKLPVSSKKNQPQLIRRKLAEAYLGWARQLGGESDAADKRANAIAQAEQLLNSLLQKLGEQDPARAAVLADLGDVALLQGHYASAQKRYQDSLAQQDDKQVQVKLGRAYLLAGRPEKAQTTFSAVLKENPHWAPAQLGLGDSYRAQGELKQAAAQYIQAFREGQALDYSQRRQIALDALQIAPNDLEMRLALADFYYQEHVYQGANEQYQAVLKLNSHSARAYEGLGRVSLGKLEYAQAEQHFRTALAQSPSLKMQIELYQEMVKTERGAVGPGKPLREAGQAALYQLAALYLQSGQLQQSWQELKELQKSYPNHRPDQVAQLIRQLTKTVGDNLPGRPVADQGHQIIAPGASHPAYNSTPPTSGWHYVLPSSWGIHASPIPNEVQLRNLASGGVLVQYRPEASQSTLQQLRGLVAKLRQDKRYCRLILAPYPGLGHQIVLTAWRRIDRLDEYDHDRIVRFIEAFLGGGPEQGEVGCSP